MVQLNSAKITFLQHFSLIHVYHTCTKYEKFMNKLSFFAKEVILFKIYYDLIKLAHRLLL